MIASGELQKGLACTTIKESLRATIVKVVALTRSNRRHRPRTGVRPLTNGCSEYLTKPQ